MTLCQIALSVVVYGGVPGISWFCFRQINPKRKKVEPVKEIPCPSDVLIDLIILKMQKDPGRLLVKTSGYWKHASWEDKQSGIKILAQTHRGTFRTGGEAKITLFTHRGKPLAPTHEAYVRLQVALDQAHAWNLRAAEAERQYQGDMQACQAIEEMTK
jgi:hypothetical protein